MSIDYNLETEGNLKPCANKNAIILIFARLVLINFILACSLPCVLPNGTINNLHFAHRVFGKHLNALG